MRNTKTLQIKGIEKPITVYELTVKQIMGLMQDDPFGDKSLDELKKVLDTNVLPLCSTLTLEELMEFAPSELETIWSDFKEVNKTFFELARKTGMQETMQEILETLKKAVFADFSELLAGLSNRDTPTP